MGPRLKIVGHYLYGLADMANSGRFDADFDLKHEILQINAQHTDSTLAVCVVIEMVLNHTCPAS